MSGTVMLGLYGKLPSHGDFLRRRIQDAFVAGWDQWLQASVAASRAALGDRWLDRFLTSPVWRFACSAGACGPAPVIGLIVPSVDRVGRYFPFTLVGELSPVVALFTAIRETESLLEAAEGLLLDALQSDPLDFDAFDARIVALSRERGLVSGGGLRLDSDQARTIVNAGRIGNWQIPIGSHRQLPVVFEQLLGHRFGSAHEPYSIWWSDGSEMVEPSCLIVNGLPAPESFAALLDGSWSQASWEAVHVDFDDGVAAPGDTVVSEPLVVRYRSAAATDVGRVRRVNQDSFLERTGAGVWAVADGLGGYSEGDVASRMVCDRLAELVPESDFEQMIESARRSLLDVNAYLHRKSIQAENAVRSGSTVVALFARGARCAVLWAGDSRVYRWRGGHLEQLTRDHSVAAEEQSPAPAEANAITRAVGGERELELDVRYDRVQVGDRLLLCSDGLSRVLSDQTLCDCLGRADIRTVADDLIAATLAAGAPDNVTALVVEAYGDITTAA